MSAAVPMLAACVLLFTAYVMLVSRRSVARAAFTVDWGAMASVPGDEQAEKVRQFWQEGVVRQLTAPRSAEQVSDLLDRAAMSEPRPPERRPTVTEVASRLHVAVVPVKDTVDRFVVEVAVRDERWALALAARVADDSLALVRDNAFVGAGAASVRSYAAVDELNQREVALRQDHRPLRQQGRGLEAAEVDHELAGLEFQRFAAGIGLVANLGKLFGDDSAKLVEPAHLVGRRARPVLSTVLLISMATALAVGALRWVCRQRRERKRPYVGGAPPVMPLQPPVLS